MNVIICNVCEFQAVSETPHIRCYVSHQGDDDIKWQWSVQDYPCNQCRKFADKRNWISKLFGKKHELTNVHKAVVKKPKFWEAEYYDYLFPESWKKGKNKEPYDHDPVPNYEFECGPWNSQCEGRQINYCSKGNSGASHAMSLNTVTDSAVPPENKRNNHISFVCLNHLVDSSVRGNQCEERQKP